MNDWGLPGAKGAVANLPHRGKVRREGWRPPPYPYDGLSGLMELAQHHDGGAVDLSVGTPCDPPSKAVLEAFSIKALLATSGGYPASIGSLGFRRSAAGWIHRRFGVELPADAVAACVGTKELVAGLPAWLALRSQDPNRTVVLYPEISYPTYAMGAELAGMQAVPVPCDELGRLDLSQVSDDDAARAMLLWVNSPSNPTGALSDLGSAARWGRERGVVVASDECYVELTWTGRRRSILQEGLEGLLAVHSLSKRSNMAGLRVGFYAGDPELVGYLSEVRKHAGLMVPGPVQLAAIVALDDDEHVELQRQIYKERLELFSQALSCHGLNAPMPDGGFYIWASCSPEPAESDISNGGPLPSWELARWLAEVAGCVVAPGDLYGETASFHVRVAMVQPIERLELAVNRMRLAGSHCSTRQ
ncbi:MAG: aminotransferase class I/II-fold pyridoxal phosphate-dependent enzyme [Actinobacteria bacterium]|nr:aminotransferase class I/II-fold pyridoxal phosphate-dependent enzyme [Actinomycetota bacterium]